MRASLKISFLTLLFSMFYSIEIMAQDIIPPNNRDTIVTAIQDATLTVNQDDAITRLLALKKSVNETKKNYTIRAFRGQRDESEKALSAYRSAFSEWRFELKQAYPAYEILLGNFRTRLEVERALIKLKSKCSTAFKKRSNLKNKCLQSFPVPPKT